MHRTIRLAGLAVAWTVAASPALAQAGQAPTAQASTAGTPSSDKVFKAEELDQMLAPIALYPDALLAQLLMATTYPGEVKEAAAWSKANPKASGDSAVKMVAGKTWDPSVQSLVAFPSVMAMLGDKPEWVQRIGDAFLAQPDEVMASVQKLRKAAKAAGNLESNEQQKVSVDTQQAIIIEPAQPQVVYVPAYSPSVVYGTWWWPAYPPYYYPPHPAHYPGYAVAVGISWGIRIAAYNSFWGGCHWHGGGNVYINVNRYNNINVNNRINAGGGRGQANWNHRPEHRGGAPYRDGASRDRYGKDRAGASQRQDYRGREQSGTRDVAGAGDRAGQLPTDARAADRASQLPTDARATDRAAQRPTDARSADRARAQQSMDRAGIGSGGSRVGSGSSGGRGSAMSGVSQPRATASHSARGNSSRSSMRSSGGGGRMGGGGRR